jgi:hypothetical protein
MHKSSILLVVFIFFHFSNYGQEPNTTSLCISTGINISEYGDRIPPTLTTPAFFEPKLGGDFSVFGDIQIYKQIYLRTGISYSYTSSRFSIPEYYPNLVAYIDFPPFYTNILAASDISIPVLIKLNFTKTSNSIYIAAGIDPIYNANSHLTTFDVNEAQANAQNGFIFSSVHTNTFGLDYKILIGKHVQISKKRFFIELQFRDDLIGWKYQLLPAFNYPYANPTLPLWNHSGTLVLGWVI